MQNCLYSMHVFSLKDIYIYTTEKKLEKILMVKNFLSNNNKGISLVVQWLRLCASNAGGESLIPGQGTKVPRATGHSQKINFKKLF